MSLVAQNITVASSGKMLLDNVSLHLKQGQLHVILGANGAGKTSLLNVCSGLMKPQQGTVRLNDAPLSTFCPLTLAVHRAVLPQRVQPAFSVSVNDLLALSQEPRRRAIAKGLVGRAKKTSDSTIHELTTQMDIAQLLQRIYHTLSGGEQQRVQLARVLAQQTDCVLLDEPLSALDIAHQHTVMQLLASLAAQGKAILVVLHDINIALRYATHITLLHQGSVHAQGAPDVVITETALKTVYGIDAQITLHPTTKKIQIQVI